MTGVSVQRGFSVHPAAVTSSRRLGVGRDGEVLNSRHLLPTGRDAGKSPIQSPGDPGPARAAPGLQTAACSCALTQRSQRQEAWCVSRLLRVLEATPS